MLLDAICQAKENNMNSAVQTISPVDWHPTFLLRIPIFQSLWNLQPGQHNLEVQPRTSLDHLTIPADSLLSPLLQASILTFLIINEYYSFIYYPPPCNDCAPELLGR